ncbi:helix-turn-helix transcriptional regulator [Brevibacillus halotolerans]|uniref:helix-turn-helix domain-containing protein n=1 Tax=Brevibacillus TaxID=55080 RepID=UPI00215B9669|nr:MULTISPECIES: helix-turn-helix transcriptional regulator [Brevibacillus]MCR8964181.1 helix-turn-helix domain-containing protein [Brevibacillus laterosporus]MCZ0836336.1 helix-turn-helix transcriptional regulator [Brevibacillus halotolerans]
MGHNLTYTTIGELIRKKREEKGIGLSELGRMTGVTKGTISKIETGEIKSPRMKHVKPITDVLEMPYEEVIEYYIQSENRNAILHDFLIEVAEFSNLSLIEKIAMKFLENSKKSTNELLQNLVEIAGTFENSQVSLTIYNTVIKYARLHGESQYIAKGLYEKYMIERENLKRLEESFKVGEECLHYVDFLSQKEKIMLYYRMSLHAHNIKKYDKCLELGEIGHTEDETMNELKERVALAICNSYLRTDNFSKLEEHLDMYERLGYQSMVERTKVFRSVLLSKTGQLEDAIPLLKECVVEAESINRLPRVNALLEALLSSNDVDSVQQVIETEENNFAFDYDNVYNLSELGKYFKYKGGFLTDQGLFEKGIDSYLRGMNYFSKINDREGIMECSEKIYAYHCEHGKEMNLGLLKKMKEVYNKVNNGDERGGKSEETFNCTDDCFTGIV